MHTRTTPAVAAAAPIACALLFLLVASVFAHTRVELWWRWWTTRFGRRRDGGGAKESFRCTEASIPSNVVQRYTDEPLEVSSLDTLRIKSLNLDVDRRFATCAGAAVRTHGELASDEVPSPGDRVWVRLPEPPAPLVVGYVHAVDANARQATVRLDRMATAMEQLVCMHRSGVLVMNHPSWQKKRRRMRVERVDAQHNLLVVVDEAVDALREAGMRKARHTDIQALIARYDVDGNNTTLDLVELARVLKGAGGGGGGGGGTARTEVRDTTAKLTADIAEVVRRAQRKDPGISARSIMEQFDANSDGLLTRAEFVAFLQYMGFTVVDDRGGGDPDGVDRGEPLRFTVVRVELQENDTPSMMRVDLHAQGTTTTTAPLRGVSVSLRTRGGSPPCFFTPALSAFADPHDDDPLRTVHLRHVYMRPTRRMVEECFARASEAVLHAEDDDGEEATGTDQRGDTVGRVILEHARSDPEDGSHTWRCKYTLEGAACDARDALHVYHAESAQWYPLAEELDATWAREISTAIGQGRREHAGDGYAVAYAASGGVDAEGHPVQRLTLTLLAEGTGQLGMAERGTRRAYAPHVGHELAFFPAEGGSGADARASRAASRGDGARFGYVYDVNNVEARLTRMGEFLDRCDVEPPANPDPFRYQTKCEKELGIVNGARPLRSCPAGCNALKSAKRRYYCRNPDALKRVIQYPRKVVGSLWPEVPCPKPAPKPRCTIPYPKSDYGGGACPFIRDPGECASLYPTCEWKRGTLRPADPSKALRALREGDRVMSNYKGEGTFHPGVIARKKGGEYDVRYDDARLGTEVGIRNNRCVYRTQCGEDLLTPAGYERVFGDAYEESDRRRERRARSASARPFRQGQRMPSFELQGYDRFVMPRAHQNSGFLEQPLVQAESAAVAPPLPEVEMAFNMTTPFLGTA
jgi:hypothetical protein